MTTVYLIRHSVRLSKDYIESYHTDQDVVLRNEKIILSVEGEERAKLLSEKAELQNLDVLYASNAVRTIQTAKYFMESQNLKINLDDRLNEKVTGIPSNEPDAFAKQFYDQDYRNVNGESQREVRKRFDEAFDEIIEKNKNKRIAIFSHGFAITFFLLRYCTVEVNGIVVKYTFNGKVIFEKRLNAPEVFKMTLDGDKVIDIELIEFDDIPYRLGV